jgi:hypothetical protein
MFCLTVLIVVAGTTVAPALAQLQQKVTKLEAKVKELEKVVNILSSARTGLNVDCLIT